MTNMLDPSSTPKPHEHSAGSGPVALRDLLNSVFYYRRAGLLAALCVVVLGCLAALLIPPSYTARARLLTLNASVYDMQPGTTANAPLQDPTAAVNTEMQLLASPELHRSIVRAELGPGGSADALNRRVREFESHLHITKVEAANVIELEYSDRNAEHSASALKALLAGYFKERADVLTSGRVDFLEQQRDKVAGQLERANREIAEYEKLNGVVDVEDQVKGAVALDDNLHQHEQEAEAEEADNQKSVLVLLNDAKEQPTQVELYTDNSEAAHTMGTMQASLLQLEAKRADLAARYMATSPFVQQVDAQIAELRASIKAQQKDLITERRTGYNSNRDTTQDRLIQAQADLAGARARRAVLSGQVAASGNHLKALIAVSDNLAQMRMQRDMLADTVKNYSAQLEQARIQQNQATTSGSTNVRVIEAPVPPTRRNNPPLLILAAAVVAAIVIAGVVVFLLSTLRETFLSAQEAERGLDLPVLCVLPRRNPDRSQVGRLVSTISSSQAGGSGNVSFTGVASKVVLLLAPHSAEDLTTVSQLLVTALDRRSPGRVALLDLRSTSNNTTPTMQSVRGIPMGTLDVGLTREHLLRALMELRHAYDTIVVTAPPASTCFESVESSVAADLVFLVVRAEETRRPVAQAIIDQVAQMGVQVDGLVLTGRRYHIPSWLYGAVLGRRLATQ
jgi:uncharacterized protein involved in exopolysaccharide biosynthesis